MKKEPIMSIVSAEKIKEYIVNEYSPAVFKVNTYSGGKIDIYIMIEKNKKGYVQQIPYRFEEKDIVEIAKDILAKDNIQSKNEYIKVSKTQFQNETIFEGVAFTWIEETTEDNIAISVSEESTELQEAIRKAEEIIKKTNSFGVRYRGKILDGRLYGSAENYSPEQKAFIDYFKNKGYKVKVVCVEKQLVDIYIEISWF